MLATFQAWLSTPFSSGMDALHWFLFFGLIIVSMIMWGMILRTIEGI